MISLLLGAIMVTALATPALAHESRDVGDLELEVGLVGEPVYVGQESGLELLVSRGGQPVEGVDATLEAEVIYGSASLTLALEPMDEGAPGYAAAFIPTAAGKYTFHIHGTIDGTPVDETFTSSPTGFDEVLEAASGQFPVQLPTLAEVSAASKQGADAAALVPVALGIGVLGLIVGLLGLGVALAGRRRPLSDAEPPRRP
jgi:hypothetical protein